MHGEYADLNSFIEHASLVMDSDKESTGEVLTVMTLHASKGLEFDVVFLPGWEEGLFPHAKSLDERGGEALEEERRLAYVGLTRARKKAFISFASNRKVYGSWQNALPSRFVDELPEEHISFQSARGLYGGRSYGEETSYRGWSTKPSYQRYEEDSSDTWGRTSGMFDTYKKPSKDVGVRVYHEKFGYGTIVASEGEKVTVRFDRGREAKKLLRRFVEEI